MRSTAVVYLRRALWLALCLYALAIVSRVITTNKQWDFEVYYHAAQTYFTGGNPYDRHLSDHGEKEVLYPFVYPVYTVWLFRPFTVLPLESARWWFFALKLAAIVTLIALWAKAFLEDKALLPLLLVLCAMAYRETITRDLYTGNVSIFEQLLLWGAFFWLLRKKPGPFCVLVALAALFKLTLIVFLPLALLVDRSRRSWVAVGGVALAFGGLQLGTALLEPEMTRGFLRNVASIVEHDKTNPSSLSLIYDSLERQGFSLDQSIDGTGLFLFETGDLALVFYALFVGGLVTCAWRTYRQLGSLMTRWELVVMSCLLYAAVSPRLKAYSFIFLIPPTVAVIHRAFPDVLARVVVVAAVCISAFPYQPLFTSLVMLLAFTVYVRSRSPIPVAVASEA